MYKAHKDLFFIIRPRWIAFQKRFNWKGFSYSYLLSSYLDSFNAKSCGISLWNAFSIILYPDSRNRIDKRSRIKAWFASVYPRRLFYIHYLIKKNEGNLLNKLAGNTISLIPSPAIVHSKRTKVQSNWPIAVNLWWLCSLPFHTFKSSTIDIFP